MALAMKYAEKAVLLPDILAVEVLEVQSEPGKVTRRVLRPDEPTQTV